MRLGIGLVIATLTCSAAFAEDIVTLDAILDGNPEQSYKYIRCAAFYRANLNWAADYVDQSASDQFVRVITALLYVGTDLRSLKTGEDFASVFPAVQADAATILQVYAENYRQSYALRGAAWEGNPLWESDEATCKLVGAAAFEMISGLLEESKQ